MRQPQLIKSGHIDIVYLDFSEIKKKEDILAQIEVFGHYIRKQPLHSVYTLTNLENMYFNTEIYNHFTAYVKENNPYIKGSAVIGLKGMMQIFYKSFIKLTGRNVKVCSSKEEAIAELSNQMAVPV
ncbi:MAG: hypothetical protein JXR22_03450 [Prolixibacteraceae bacterium]|nr:hypothetical protein [Prolixibacteraceae bacterium]